MPKIDEPRAMELAPIAEARMIFGRSPKIELRLEPQGAPAALYLIMDTRAKRDQKARQARTRRLKLSLLVFHWALPSSRYTR